MNNIKFKIVSILVLAGFLSSCESLLDAPTKSSMDEQVIFSTPVLAESALMGIHQSLSETNSYRGRFIPFYGLNSDIEIYNSSENITDDRAWLTAYDPRVNSIQMNTDNNAWAKMYEGIERANLAIRGLRNYGNVDKNAQLAQILGEALTLRAMIYYDLIKAWGDVPARFEPLTTASLYIPRTDRDTIYKKILSDLEEAESLVPWPNETRVTSTVERVNKSFVKGMYARIALAAAGYSQRADGTIRLSNDPELSKDALYPKVKKHLVEVIESNTNKLGTFEQNFRNLCLERIAAGQESIYELPFSEGRGRVLYTFGVRHTTVDKYTQQAQGGNNGPLPTLFYDYDKDDVRRNITCVPYEWTNGVQVPRQLKSWCFGKLRYEWMTRVVTSTNDDGINWQVMRLADVYLMAAEVINYLEGPASAAPYLKAVRERAFAGNADKVNAFMAQATASKEAFFDAIVDERAFEFAGEMLRKADLIRWNLLKTKLVQAREKLIRLSERSGEYADYPEKIYFKTLANGETLEIYGLEKGHSDAYGKDNYPSSKGWFISNGVPTLTTDKINSLYLRDPDTRQHWPIWQVFLDASNYTLVNYPWFNTSSN
jgi:hypothetical protein